MVSPHPVDAYPKKKVDIMHLVRHKEIVRSSQPSQPLLRIINFREAGISVIPLGKEYHQLPKLFDDIHNLAFNPL